MFIAGYDDHVRNRLSHTLEVSQIARTISKALSLNETLTEAIALGHDLGHTPFGHVGERVLNDISYGRLVLPEKKYCHEENDHGFKHNWQSVRVACNLEYHNISYPGLNLTNETLWGFLHHSKLTFKKDKVPFFETNYKKLLPDENYWTFEAIIVAVADEIAQRHHDIEDGLITGILDKDNLIEELNSHFSTFRDDNLNQFLKKASNNNYQEFYLSMLAKAIVNFYVTKVISYTKIELKKIKKDFSISESNSFYKKKSEIWKNVIKSESDFTKKMMSQELYDADKSLQEDYFKKRILLSHQAQKNDGKAAYVIKKIAEAYLTNPQQMPDNAVIMLFINYYRINKEINKERFIDASIEAVTDVFCTAEKKAAKADRIGSLRIQMDKESKNNNCTFKHSLIRTVIDYIAGMTDDYALAVYEQLYGGTKQNRY